MDRMETERIEEETQSENPEDVAVLYSWAKLQGAKYRDFSASRRAYRAQMRHRAAELQRETERRAQLEAEATASATEKAAREAEEVARYHDSAARRAALEAKQEESVVEEAASARAMRTAAELARRASAERVEAARRAEAVAAAEAAARREELEMAEAHASAQRQARQYESDGRRKVAAGPQLAGGTTSDPYTANTVPTRPDRMYHQVTTPEEDMQPMRYRQSRDSGRYVVPQPNPALAVNPDVPLKYVPAGPLAREAESAVAAEKSGAERNAELQLYPPMPAKPTKVRERRALDAAVQGLGQERRVYDQRAHDRESQTTEREPWFPERIQMSRETEEMAPERKSYATGSETYAARVTAPPLAGRTHSGLRIPTVREPDTLAEPRSYAAPRAEFRSEPRMDVLLEPNALSMVEIDGVLQPERRRKPRPDFSNLPLRDYRPDPEMNGSEQDPTVPAWISGDTPRPEPKRPSLPSSPVEDTLQHTRERVASRWFALKGVFDQGTSEAQESLQRAKEMRAPMVTVFSLAGGVGKTSLIATLGRALSSNGERVLLTDTTSHGLLPFYFGASELRPGAVRTFSPPAGSADAPIYMVSYDVNQRTGDAESEQWLDDELSKNSRNMQRVLVDLTPGAAWVARRLARMNSIMLVPVAPDMNSVISLAGVEKFFAGMSDSEGRPVQPFYVLNQFDASLPLHLDVREVMRRQLGDRLLPFAIRRSPSVSEALAEGMTVMDYAPDSVIAGDYMNVVQWLRAQAAPAVADFRSARWSERSDR